MKRLIMLVGLLLGGAACASAGSFTTTPEQDKTLAAIAAEKKTTPQAVVSDMLDRLGSARAKQQQIQEMRAVQQACTKGDQKACDAISTAAKNVKK